MANVAAIALVHPRHREPPVMPPKDEWPSIAKSRPEASLMLTQINALDPMLLLGGDRQT